MEQIFNLLFPDLKDDEFVNVRFIAQATGGRREFFCRSTGEIGDRLREHPPPWNAYWSPGIRKGNKPKESGRKAAVVRTWAVWADVDTKCYSGDKAAARRALDEHPKKPSILISTGGGFHPYWLLKEPAESFGLIEAERAMKALKSQLGGDAVQDVSRILRIPGTLNCKPEYPEPLPVEVVYCDPDRRYDLSEFLIEPPGAAPAAQGSPIAALIAPYWEVGQRNVLAMALSGFMAKEGMTLAEAREIVQELAGGDEEVESRLRTCDQTYDKHRRGHRVLGLMGLKDILTAADTERLCRLVKKSGESPPTTEGPSSGEPWYLSANQLLNIEFPPEKWLIESLWGDNAVGFIGGAPKVGKTWFGLEMAVCIATGADMFEMYKVPAPGPALYIAGEDHQRYLKDRLQMLLEGKGLTAAALGDRLHIATARRVLDSDEWRNRVEEACRTLKPRALFLDPLIRMHGADENSATELAKVLGFLRDLQQKYNCAVVVIHHLRKPKGGNASHPGNELRGSVDLFGWLDSFLSLSSYKADPDGPSLVRVETFHRNAPELPPFIVSVALKDTAKFAVSEVPATTDGDTEMSNRILGFLEVQPERWATKQQIRDGVPGKEETKLAALKRLEEDGQIVKGSKQLPARDHKMRAQVVYSLPEDEP